MVDFVPGSPEAMAALQAQMNALFGLDAQGKPLLNAVDSVRVMNTLLQNAKVIDEAVQEVKVNPPPASSMALRIALGNFVNSARAMAAVVAPSAAGNASAVNAVLRPVMAALRDLAQSARGTGLPQLVAVATVAAVLASVV